MGTEDKEKQAVQAAGEDEIDIFADGFPNFDDIMLQLDDIMTKLDTSLSEYSGSKLESNSQEEPVKSYPIESRPLKAELNSKEMTPSEPIETVTPSITQDEPPITGIYSTYSVPEEPEFTAESIAEESADSSVDESVAVDDELPQTIPEPRVPIMQAAAPKPAILRTTDPNLPNGVSSDAELVFDGEVIASGEDVKEQPEKKKKKKSALSRVFEVAFYGILVVVIVFVFANTGKNEGAPRSLFGFAMSSVLTSSMQSELPKGCIILIKKVDTSTLILEDNITFIQADNTTVTHKIVGIHENYNGSGQLGFVTEGTENGLPDDEIVLAENVVGKVIWHSNVLGKALNYVKENLVFVGVMAVLVIGFFIALRVFISTGKDDYDDDEDEEEEEPPRKNKRR